MKILSFLTIVFVVSLLFVACGTEEETLADVSSDVSDIQQSDSSADTTLAPGECLEHSDCTENGASCKPADAAASCGNCQQLPSCVDDASCAAENPGSICDARPMCLCSGGATCVGPCTSDSQCNRNEVCGTDGHCGPRSCVDAACPSTFMCDGEGSVCLRRMCTSAADCAATDFCVAGQCASEVGVCEMAVP